MKCLFFIISILVFCSTNIWSQAAFSNLSLTTGPHVNDGDPIFTYRFGNDNKRLLFQYCFKSGAGSYTSTAPFYGAGWWFTGKDFWPGMPYTFDHYSWGFFFDTTLVADNDAAKVLFSNQKNILINDYPGVSPSIAQIRWMENRTKAWDIYGNVVPSYDVRVQQWYLDGGIKFLNQTYLPDDGGQPQYAIIKKTGQCRTTTNNSLFKNWDHPGLDETIFWSLNNIDVVIVYYNFVVTYYDSVTNPPVSKNFYTKILLRTDYSTNSGYDGNAVFGANHINLDGDWNNPPNGIIFPY